MVGQTPRVTSESRSARLEDVPPECLPPELTELDQSDVNHPAGLPHNARCVVGDLLGEHILVESRQSEGLDVQHWTSFLQCAALGETPPGRPKENPVYLHILYPGFVRVFAMRTPEEFLEQCNALMSGQEPKLILRQAKALLLDEQRWARGALARDAAGRNVRPEHPTACCWSLGGAVARACNDVGILPPYFIVFIDRVVLEEFGSSDGFSVFNDYYSHESVLALLDKCLERLP